MKFELLPDDKAALEKLVKSKMTPIIISQRARILLYKAKGRSSISIAEELHVNRHTVELWCQKYRNRTDEQTIMDILSVSSGRGRKEEITGEAKTWLISIACMKPKDLGYAAETWTTSALTKHINATAKDAGFERLTTITESGVYKILDKANIKPFRIQYYCERRDPDFDTKMHNVLLVYKQLSLQFDEEGNLLPFGDEEVTHILSYDEKPGIQAIANTSEDKLPNIETGVIKRDYEYKLLEHYLFLQGLTYR